MSNVTTQERLKELLHYNPDTGFFTWRKPTSVRMKVGERAGSKMSIGYRHIGIDGTRYAEHRLAFLYMLGRLPHIQVDHKDGTRDNNKWSNLREATQSQNMRNTKLRVDNSTGYRGVHLHQGGYRAVIYVDGSRKDLGVFKTAEAAHAVYKNEANKAFGEFRRAE